MNEVDVTVLYASDKHPADDDSGHGFGHPVHQGFADSIGAEPFVFSIPELGPLSGTILESVATASNFDIPESDLYLVEHTHTLFSAPLIKQFHSDATVIFLAADHRLAGLDGYNLSDRSFPSTIRKVDRLLDVALLKILIRRYVDGVIANSAWNADLVHSISDDTPTRTSLPYIQSEQFDRLVDVTPDLQSKTAVTIGTGLDYKGIDRLVDVWPRIRNAHGDATLRVVGPGHPDRYERTDGVEVTGFVPDIAAELADAAVYIHPARAEAFGVTVIEAMRAGVPPIVSDMTGAQSEVVRIDESLVTKSEPAAIANRVIEYFDSSVEQRYMWSETARTQSSRFDPSSRKAAFRRSFESLIHEIGLTGCSQGHNTT